MAKVTMHCPKCQNRYRVEDSVFGKKVRCKKCHARFVIRKQHDKRQDRNQPVAKDGTPVIWSIGDVILDQYEVTAELGEGGMGKVHKVHHRSWNLDLAVKSPKPNLFLTQSQKEDFVRECDSWVNLGLNPHTVSCYYVRELGGIPRVFAEYVEGGSLKDWIRDRGGRLGRLYQDGCEQALERILAIAIQFAWGLHYAHERGLVHQDVKPANVMLTANGTAKVTDFGLAKAQAQDGEQQPRDQQNILVSYGGMTPAYCSPEQSNKDKLTRQTDIWSWAVSVLEMFTGGVTWPTGSIANMALEAYLETGAGNERIPPMPADLAEILQHCLQLAPASRPQTMHKVAQFLLDSFKKHVRFKPPPKNVDAIESLSDTLNNHALSMMDLGKHTEAEELWKRALTIDPEHLMSNYNHGLLCWRRGQISDLDLLRCMQSKRDVPQEDTRDILLAQIHLERNDPRNALEAINDALEAIEAKESIERSLEMIDLGTCKHDDFNERSRVAKSLRNITRQRLETHPRLIRCKLGMPLHDFELAVDGNTALLCLFTDDRRSVIHQAWDLSNGVKLWSTGLDSKTIHADLSASGDCVLLNHEGKTRTDVLDMRSGKQLSTLDWKSSDVRDRNDIAKSKRELIRSEDVLTLWDLEIGEKLREWSHGHKYVKQTSLLQAGKLALSLGSSEDLKADKLRLWDVNTGSCLREIDAKGYNLAVVPDRDLAAFVGKEHICVWDLNQDQPRTLEGDGESNDKIAITPDGRFVVAMDQFNPLCVWNADTGEGLARFEHPNYGSVASLSVSPDCRFALVHFLNFSDGNTKWRQYVRLFNLMNGQCMASMDNYDRFLNLDLPHRSDRFECSQWVSVGESTSSGFFRVVESDFVDSETDEIQVWTITPDLSYQAPVEVARIRTSIERTRDDSIFMSCLADARRDLTDHRPKQALENLRTALHTQGRNKDDSLWELWSDLTRVSRRGRLRDAWCTKVIENRDLDAASLFGVAISRNGSRAVVTSRHRQLQVLDLSKGVPVNTFECDYSVTGLTLSECGHFAASAIWDGKFCVWDVRTGGSVRTFDIEEFQPVFDVTPDCRFAVAGDSKGKLHVYDVMTGTCLRSLDHGRYLSSVGIFADGRIAVSSGGAIKAWDLANCSCIRTLECPGDGAFALANDGQTVVSAEIAIRNWNLVTGEIENRGSSLSSVSAVATTPDGQIALAGCDDGTLRVCDGTEQLVPAQSGHSQKILSVAISPDGTAAITDSADGTIRVWRLTWELEVLDPADWDEGAREYLESFLTQHTPCSLTLRDGQKPTEEESTLALTRRGAPAWTEGDFQDLLLTLGQVGHGNLLSKGVRKELDEMASKWHGPSTQSLRSITLDNLLHQLHEVVDDIEQNGEVWEVKDQIGGDYVLVPERMGMRVLGLVDVEYGWPVEVDVDADPEREQLVRSRRQHPFLMRQGRCIAVALSQGEYEDILKLVKQDEQNDQQGS